MASPQLLGGPFSSGASAPIWAAPTLHHSSHALCPVESTQTGNAPSMVAAQGGDWGAPPQGAAVHPGSLVTSEPGVAGVPGQLGQLQEGRGPAGQPEAVHACVALVLALGRLRHFSQAVIGLQVLPAPLGGPGM